MLSEIAKKYYIDENLNCAQAVFLTISDMHNLGYTVEDSQIVAAFGGGMGCGDTCGALAGGMAILGKIVMQKGETRSTELRPAAVKFHYLFNDKLSHTRCDILKPKYMVEKTRCLSVVVTACEILEEVVKDM